MHLNTEECYAINPSHFDENAEDKNLGDISNWQAKIVWGNYHACTMSSLKFDGFDYLQQLSQAQAREQFENILPILTILNLSM